MLNTRTRIVLLIVGLLGLAPVLCIKVFQSGIIPSVENWRMTRILEKSPNGAYIDGYLRTLISVNGKRTIAVIDTGANRSLLSDRFIAPAQLADSEKNEITTPAGTIPAFFGKIPEMKIGEMTFTNAEVQIAHTDMNLVGAHLMLENSPILISQYGLFLHAAKPNTSDLVSCQKSVLTYSTRTDGSRRLEGIGLRFEVNGVVEVAFLDTGSRKLLVGTKFDDTPSLDKVTERKRPISTLAGNSQHLVYSKSAIIRIGHWQQKMNYISDRNLIIGSQGMRYVIGAPILKLFSLYVDPNVGTCLVKNTYHSHES